MPRNTDDRKFVPEKGKTLPETDFTATYRIFNRQFSPISVTITDPSRTQMQSLPIGARGSRIVDGNRMTDIIWELESQRMIEVTKIPNE